MTALHRLSWAAALYQWLRVTEDRVLVTLKRADMKRLSEATTLEAARKMYDFIIVSYDLLKDTQPVLTALDIRVVILDESHCIKNSTVRQQRLEGWVGDQNPGWHAATRRVFGGGGGASRAG